MRLGPDVLWHCTSSRLVGSRYLIGLEDFAADTFGPYVGTTFLFRCGQPADAVVRLKLAEVRCTTPPPPTKPGAPHTVRSGGCFSLLFVAETEMPSASGLYRLDHPDFAPSELLLNRVSVPWRRAEEAPLFEAVFG
jgi:hypothetical protein